MTVWDNKIILVFTGYDGLIVSHAEYGNTYKAITAGGQVKVKQPKKWFIAS